MNQEFAGIQDLKKTQNLDDGPARSKYHRKYSSTSKPNFNLIGGDLIGETSLKGKFRNRNISNDLPFAEEVPELVVREYFLAKPSRRINFIKAAAQKISSTTMVLEVLDWSTKAGIQEAYDAGVNLIAKCSNIILDVANQQLINFSSNNWNEAFVADEKWEILLKGIACSENINQERKLETISSLITQTNRRAVKAAIIDSLLILEGEFDFNVIKEYLDYFLSDTEPDEYIREYAQDAIE